MRVFVLLLGLVLSACTTRYPVKTDDGLSASFPTQASMLAESVAGELIRMYPAGSTVVCILSDSTGQSGAFGQTLERELRQAGFAVSSDPANADVLIGYQTDSIETDMGLMGYWRLMSSDGSMKSCSKPVRLP